MPVILRSSIFRSGIGARLPVHLHDTCEFWTLLTFEAKSSAEVEYGSVRYTRAAQTYCLHAVVKKSLVEELYSIAASVDATRR